MSPISFLRETGFTAIELLVTIAIVVILASIAAPNLSIFITSSRMTSLANDLVADIRLARSAAAARGIRVELCPTADGSNCSTVAADWAKGRIIFADANSDGVPDASEIIKIAGQASSGSRIEPKNFSNLVAVIFNPYGGVLPLGTRGYFLVCPNSSNPGRTVNVDVSGRPSVTKTTCS